MCGFVFVCVKVFDESVLVGGGLELDEYGGDGGSGESDECDDYEVEVLWWWWMW